MFNDLQQPKRIQTGHDVFMADLRDVPTNILHVLIHKGLPWFTQNHGDLRAPVLANVGPNRLAQGDFRDFPQASVSQLPGDVSSWRHQYEPSLEFLPAIWIIFCFGPDDYDLQIEWRPIVYDDVRRIIEKLYMYNITMQAYGHTYTHIPKSCRNPGLMSLEAMNWFAISLGPFEPLMGDWAAFEFAAPICIKK